MILGILGIIAIGMALLLIYYSRQPGPGASGARAAKRVQATVVPEKQYKRSEDGKVVYLFDDDDDRPGGAADTSYDAGDADEADAGDVVDIPRADPGVHGVSDHPQDGASGAPGDGGSGESGDGKERQ